MLSTDLHGNDPDISDKNVKKKCSYNVKELSKLYKVTEEFVLHSLDC